MEQLERRFEVSQWMAEDFAGVISEERKALLEGWRRESAVNEEEYQELLRELRGNKGIPTSAEKQKMQQQWDKFAKVYSRRKIRVRRWMAYAAGLTLVLGIAGVLRWQTAGKAEEQAPENIEIAQNDVMLILSNGRQVAIGKDTVQLLREETAAKIEVAGKTIRYQEEGKQENSGAYNTLVVPKGGEYRIELADGSRVWLNAETEFRYPVNFTGDCRRVYLKGEAYFEVAKNTEKPFIVSTAGEVDVKVLGTRFNIASYNDEDEVVTTLAEGSVEVASSKEVVRIRPNEQLLFDKNLQTFSRRKVDANVYLAWKEGKFIFEDQTLEQIMKQLQRWYEMEVFYASDAVRNYRFSGDLKKYDDFGKIVKMIEEVAGLQISIDHQCVIIGTK